MKKSENEWVSKKVSKLVGEGYPQKQAVAIAISMEKEKQKKKK